MSAGAFCVFRERGCSRLTAGKSLDIIMAFGYNIEIAK